jgi:exodeoxyribonuclease-1
MSAIWPDVFEREVQPRPDVDEDLYGGFVSNNDRHRLNELLELSPQKLANSRGSFEDERLPELLFRYRARNFPDTLSPEEAQRWEDHRAAKLLEGEGGARNVDALLESLENLQETADARGEQILSALQDYAEEITPQI